MEPHEYQTLYEFETSYWWYRALHLVMLDSLRGLGVGPSSLVLDAGCGTGQNMVNVGKNLGARCYGFDVAGEAAPFWRKRGLLKVCRASINEIPFRSGYFDAVMSVDVLECDAVDEEHAVSELHRVLKPGGHLVLVVPAYDRLLTEEHHKAVGASRRYNRRRLAALIGRMKFEPVRMTHFYGSLLPAIAAYRLGLKYFSPRVEGPPRSELKPLSPAINELLFKIMNVEINILRRWNVPFGSSILAVARKGG